MDKNKNAEIASAVAAGLTTLWKNYKQTAARRHQEPITSLFDALFGAPEMDDVTAAKYLAQDVNEIIGTVRGANTDRKFKRIIKNNY